MRGIAVVKPDHLGDLVLSVPAIRAVRAVRADVTLFVGSASQALARFLFPDIDDIRTLDLAHLSRTGKETISPDAVAHRLNAFELVLCLRDDPVMRAIVAQLAVPYEIVASTHLAHETAIQRQATERITGRYSRTRLFSTLAHPWPQHLRHVALCMAAGFPNNRWANASWIRLAQQLHRDGVRLTLLAGPRERADLRLVSHLMGAIPHDMLMGDDDFQGFLDALDPVDLVIATDGGTAHICSLRKPVCSVFGSSPWRRYAPFGRYNVVVTRDMLCSPCVQFSTSELNGCMTRECMAAIGPAQVLAAATSNGFDFSAIGGVQVERGVSHRFMPPDLQPDDGRRGPLSLHRPTPTTVATTGRPLAICKSMTRPIRPARPYGTLDLGDPAEVAAFVAQTDALGGPDAPEAAAYWKTVRPAVPARLNQASARVHPLSQDYADLQHELYRSITGRDYADLASELTPFDKDRAAQSLLAYPDRQPRDLNRYFHAMAKLVDQFDADGPCDILDLGSGWGFTSEYMARLGHRVVAVDINPDFVEVARRRSADNRLGIDYRIGTFDNLPLGDGETFDVIMTFESFHHCRRPDAALRGVVQRLKPKGQVILSGEPFIDRGMWPSWGLRPDPLSVYCIAKFGWWESGWTREYMSYLFRSVGLCTTFVDFHSDMERFLIGRPGERFDADQLVYDPTEAGWTRDQQYLICSGHARLEFPRNPRRVVLIVFNFAPFPFMIEVDGPALREPQASVLQPGENRVEVAFQTEDASPIRSIELRCPTWRPGRVLGNGDARDIGFHLLAVEESS
ncbi:MAG: methyltransferase domain-containing protein [Gammaproteobacteria bacterium]